MVFLSSGYRVVSQKCVYDGEALSSSLLVFMLCHFLFVEFVHVEGRRTLVGVWDLQDQGPIIAEVWNS